MALFLHSVTYNIFVIKVNFDATFENHTKQSCSGLVVRNSNGRVIASKIIFNQHIPSFATKDLACQQVVYLGNGLGFRDVMIEGVPC